MIQYKGQVKTQHQLNMRSLNRSSISLSEPGGFHSMSLGDAQLLILDELFSNRFIYLHVFIYLFKRI